MTSEKTILEVEETIFFQIANRLRDHVFLEEDPHLSYGDMVEFRFMKGKTGKRINAVKVVHCSPMSVEKKQVLIAGKPAQKKWLEKLERKAGKDHLRKLENGYKGFILLFNKPWEPRRKPTL